MQILPVIDILNAVVVRGIAGQRDKYQPIKSCLTKSRDPSVVIRALQDKFGLTDFYMADLDSIQSRELNRCTIAELSRMPGNMYADCGMKTCEDVDELLALGVGKVIVALETLPDLSTARQMVRQFAADNLVFSLDLKHGRPLVSADEWVGVEPLEICRQAVDCGFQQFVVLDLAAVGTSNGTPTLGLCSELRELVPDGFIITGGGIRGVGDLKAAEDAGVDAVLVASALHDGSLTPEDLRVGDD